MYNQEWKFVIICALHREGSVNPPMKKLVCILALLALLTACLPAALADDAGTLSVQEFSDWIRKLLGQTVGVLALNAPVDESALTDDGYAFIYDHMTLYYDKPSLDADSRLQAAVLTDNALASPRGICIGDTLRDLVDLYGWLNQGLYAENGVIPLYVQDLLPDSAYWAWAQGADGRVSQLQCAVHSRVGDDRYTDAGILYTLEDDVIVGIRAYGINRTVSLQDVQNNLAVVRGEAALPTATPAPPPTRTLAQSDAAAFAPEDLSFAGLNYVALTEQTAQAALGAYQSDEWVEDDTGEWLHITQRNGLTITHLQNALRTQSHADSVVITSSDYAGPRGVRVGMPLEQAAALFACDGQNRPLGGATILYGDGEQPPYGLCEVTDDGVVLRYAAQVPAGAGKTNAVCLRLIFRDDALTEITVYTMY